MLLIDLTHTSHTRARTGIQQVCRGLYSTFHDTGDAMGITYDRYRRGWRPLAAWEEANLTATQPGSKRGAHWPLARRVAAQIASLAGARPVALPNSSGLLVPEVFNPSTAAAFPELFRAFGGPRVAIFHDAIALKVPELSPPKTVARFPGYLLELLAFDGVVAVSEDSRQSLVDYWRWVGVSVMPKLATIALPLLRARPPNPTSATPANARPIALSVGTLEGRKNHLALLEACETLWARGFEFELRLIGFAQAQTGAAALARVRELQAKGRALRYDGAVDDDALERAYREATFTVYPSLIEGFGLPVLESLAFGKPCVCSNQGALGESARGGGCLALPEVSSTALAEAIASLLSRPEQLAQLREEALRREFRTWASYRAELTGWMRELAPARS